MWPRPKAKRQIICYLVNAPPPKSVDVATSNFADALVRFAMLYHRLRSASYFI